MFKKKAQIQKASYDKENQIPVMKCSICNGERVVGFKDIHTGKFEEVLFVRNDRDLEEFKAKYGVETIGKEYWAGYLTTRSMTLHSDCDRIIIVADGKELLINYS